MLSTEMLMFLSFSFSLVLLSPFLHSRSLFMPFIPCSSRSVSCLLFGFEISFNLLNFGFLALCSDVHAVASKNLYILVDFANR